MTRPSSKQIAMVFWRVNGITFFTAVNLGHMPCV